MSRKTAGAGLQAGPAWKKLTSARPARARSALHALPEGQLPAHDAARRFWSQRTWSEFAAVPAVSQVVLSLVRHGAPLEVLGAYTSIADDEVRHAVLSRDLAERLGGYVDEVPEGLAWNPGSLAQPSDVPVHVWALANGCFSETVSLELIRARLAATTQPLVRAVLAETLKDEAVHVKVAWQLAQTLLPSLDHAEQRELWFYGQDLAETLRRTFGTAGLTGRLKTRERALRNRTADAGLGSLDADTEDRVVATTLDDIFTRLLPLLGGPPSR